MRITAGMEKITPKEAEKLLAVWDGNRTVRENAVKRMAEDMVNGRWHINGESIVISNRGELLDGQHRLLACVMSEKTLETCVVRGVEKTVLPSIDSGFNRTLGDALHFLGHKNATVAAAAASKIWNIRKLKPVDGGATAFASRQEALNIAQGEKGLEDAVRRAYHVPKKIMAPAFAAALLVVFQKKDKDLAERFIEVMTNGKTMPQPFHMLRETLLNMKPNMNRVYRGKLIIEYSIKAWNAAREGKNLGRVFHTHGEKMPSVE